MKDHVFARVDYSVLEIAGFFSELHKFIGPFHIQQTIEQGYNQVFDIWFFTDEVEIIEGESRQVEIRCELKGSTPIFTIQKYD